MTLIDLVQKLAQSKQNADTSMYIVAPIPGMEDHRVGVAEHMRPAFFIKCKPASKKPLDIHLELLHVRFDQDCELNTDTGEQLQGCYTIITLNSDSYELQSYFIEAAMLVFKKFNFIPTTHALAAEIDSLINIFTALSIPPKKTIQGLWAELLIITESKELDYLIRAWHPDKNDKYDFNDGTDKLEVKSTSTLKRIHRLSLDQLSGNKNSGLFIASVFTIQSGIGKNIFDLLSLIKSKVTDTGLLLKVTQILAQTLGTDLEKAADIHFDYALAIDSLKFFDTNSIPVISRESIPKAVSNVSFDYDFTDCSVTEKDILSLLYKAASSR